MPQKGQKHLVSGSMPGLANVITNVNANCHRHQNYPSVVGGNNILLKHFQMFGSGGGEVEQEPDKKDLSNPRNLASFVAYEGTIHKDPDIKIEKGLAGLSIDEGI